MCLHPALPYCTQVFEAWVSQQRKTKHRGVESVLGENEPSFLHEQWSQQLLNNIFPLLLKKLAKGFWIWFSVLEHCGQTWELYKDTVVMFSLVLVQDTKIHQFSLSTIISGGNENGKCVAQTEAIACPDWSPSKVQDQDPVVCHGTH